MNKALLSALAAGIAGFALVGAGVNHALPDGYWDHPAAATGAPPHDWSSLEADLSPEACAQCHAEQFDAWKHSLHAAAFSPGLIGQFPAQGLEDSNDCLRCHAPLAEQKFSDMETLNNSLAMKLEHPRGFDGDGEVQANPLPLRHAGVTCAACHVRDWQRYGPPQRGTGRTGKVSTPAHGGFTGVKAFGQSQFCASCHQFPEAYAINGKPLENTVEEWKASRFARRGVQCQTCHMPERRHEFRGIHDADMVRSGLSIDSGIVAGTARITLASVRIGHAFPTYVTPKVTVSIAALDARGEVMRRKQWEIARRVAFDEGWKELSDTRLMPDESRSYELPDLPSRAHAVRFRIDVIPDDFYKGVYRDLLDDDISGDTGKLIRSAMDATEQNDYRLYEQEIRLKN